jgi:hypothetical protein
MDSSFRFTGPDGTRSVLMGLWSTSLDITAETRTILAPFASFVRGANFDEPKI